jgi:hypothetical protein
MKSAILVMGVTLALAVPMRGDVTLKHTTSGKGMGVSAAGTSTTYIKGMKMRSEAEARGTVYTTIFDVENQKMYILDSTKKSADVWDMQAFSEEMAKTVETRDVKASVKPNGKKKEVAGETATGYDLEVAVNARMGGEKGMEMTVTLQGPMWIVKGAPGTADYIAFYKAAAEKGWIFSDPRAAKGSPGQAKAMAEMYRQLASTGGVPYETEMTISMAGEGPMASVMARMGGMSMTSTVQSVNVTALDDALFAPPPGYKLIPKK